MDRFIDADMRTLVLGIGSPIMSDDAIGLEVAKRVQSLELKGVEVLDHSTSGLDAIEIVLDFNTVIVVDSIITGKMPPGEFRVMKVEDFSHTVSPGTAHEINIFTAIEIGRRIYPERMPSQILLVAIEVTDVSTISEEMTPEVRAAIPSVVTKVVDLVENAIDQKSRC